MKHNGKIISLSPNNLSYDDISSGSMQYIHIDNSINLNVGDTLTLNIRAGTNAGDDNHHWNIGVSSSINMGISSVISKFSTSSTIPNQKAPLGEGLMFIGEYIN